MNPVVVLLLALNAVAHLVTTQPVAFHPFGTWNRPAKVPLEAQPLRTRSLPQTPQLNANYAGQISSKNGGGPLSEIFFGVMADKMRNATKWTTTTELTTSAAHPATVDIETLPGFWLKDPSKIQDSTGTTYDVDYRTERYRLDDLLMNKKRNGQDD